MNLFPNSTSTYIYRFILICFLTFFYSDHSKAQNTIPNELSKVNIYADFGGGFSRGLATINIEGRIFSGNKLTWYVRTGIGGGGIDETEGPGVLGAVTMLTDKGNNHFEINGGTFIGKNSDVPDELFFMPIADIGYRYQKPDDGFIFKASAGFLGIRFGLGYAF